MAKNIASTVREIVLPTAEQLGYLLWDVEYVREGATNILRITIDKDGGVGIDDCEKMHRAIDPLLDEADPIQQAYCLEVSSPGLERQIKNAEQAGYCIGQPINVKLFAPDEKGRRLIKGVLKEYGDTELKVALDGGDAVIEIKKAAKISLADCE